jgi:hypothetical protein
MNTPTQQRFSSQVRALILLYKIQNLDKDEYVYSKITTIAPFYVIVNHSKQAIQVA